MLRREWYPLDNAANIYPVIRNRNWTPMFRYTAVMTDPVDADALSRALTKTVPRFPGFCVRLKRGVFWYYLEQKFKPVPLEEDLQSPCPPHMPHEHAFRVKYYQNRISCEFQHIICDGSGGQTFFKTLLANYITELGTPVPATHGVLDVNEKSRPEEWEDGFARFSRMGVRPTRSEPAAYHPKGTPLHPAMRCVITGTLSVKATLEKARSYSVSITEYLCAVLMYVLYLQQEVEAGKKKRKPVKISVPVNLRKYYPTQTLRNFSQYLNPGIDPNLGEFSFEETLEQVHHYFHYMFTEKNLNARISKNVGDERNVALRVVPLFIKKAVLLLVYYLTGEKVFSSVISNVGVVDMPEEARPFIQRVDILLATANKNTLECAVASYGDTLSITFTRSVAEPHAERMFFRMLVQQGLHVLVESNQG